MIFDLSTLLKAEGENFKLHSVLLDIHYPRHPTTINIQLSLSHTEHTAYTVGHPCKPYIQPNQPWHSGHSSISVKAVYDFKTFKKLTRVPCPCIIVLAIVQDRKRPRETVRNRIYNRTRSPLHE